MALRYSAALRNAQQDAITTAAGASAIIKIFSGTKPATPETTATGTLLVTLPCSATFAAGSSGGVLTLNSITTTNAVASGTAGYFRISTAANTGTAAGIIDGDISTSGSDLNLVNTSINSGQAVGITSFTITNNNV